MSDITTATIDQKVQEALKDWRISPFRRAHVALDLIKEHIRTEHGELPEVWPVPMEWEHRVAGLAEEVPVYEVSPGAFIENAEDWPTKDEAYLEYAEDMGAPADEVAHDAIATELMKNTFDALYDGDEEAARRHIEDLWNRDPL